MAYSEKAREARRCQAKRKNGDPCTMFSVWGDPERRCSTHGGRQTSGQSATCRCQAYQFPHRAGAGFCCWPDPPERMSRIRPGTHSWPRIARYGYHFSTINKMIRIALGRKG
jgi:hypothetical protein